MLIIEQIQKRIIDIIWAADIRAFPQWKQHVLQGLRIVYLVTRDFISGHLTLRAMSLVYTTLLSLVPFIAISFSVLKGFGVQNQLEPMLLNFLAPLGEKNGEITDRIIGFVDNMKAGVLGSVGLVLLLYTSVSLLQKVERSFNYMWNVGESRPFIQRFSEYLSVILVGPVLLFTALGITASIASISLIQKLMQIQAISFIFESVTPFVPYALVIVAFTFIYMLIPNTKVYFQSALAGGLVAGILWQSAGWIFASFVVNSAKYTAIYSVFASLIFFMIWLYLSWLILLIGCSISFYYQHPEYRRLHAKATQISSRVKEKLAIAIMALVGELYYKKAEPYSAQQLATELGVEIEACNKVINALWEAKLLIKTADEVPALVPGFAPEIMLVKDVVHAVRSSGEAGYLNPLALESSESVQNAFEMLEEGVQNSLKRLTVRDLVVTDTVAAGTVATGSGAKSGKITANTKF